MTAHTAATRHEYLSNDHTLRMPGTNLKSIIVQANETFVKVPSGIVD